MFLSSLKNNKEGKSAFRFLTATIAFVLLATMSMPAAIALDEGTYVDGSVIVVDDDFSNSSAAEDSPDKEKIAVSLSSEDTAGDAEKVEEVEKNEEVAEVDSDDSAKVEEVAEVDSDDSAKAEEVAEVDSDEADDDEAPFKIAGLTEFRSGLGQDKEVLNDDLSFLKQGFIEKEEVIYIDNDEALEIEETIAYEDLPTNEAGTRIKAGAKFPVVMVSNVSSKTCKKGDVLQARLKYDLKIGPKLIAKKGSLVTGHIDYAMKARTVLHSMVSPKRWYRNSGVIGIEFDEIINGKGEHIVLNAKPARMDKIIRNKAEGRLLGVNHDGQITGPWGQQLKYKAVRIGLNAALAPAGVFSFGAMPLALGVMGAVNPSFAFMKPVGTNVPHRRIKGFCWGFLSGIPGSWIIEDTVTKGQEALVRPGDEFLVELNQEFNGKILTEAQLLPGASGKVSGDVDDNRLEKTDKKGRFKWKNKGAAKKAEKSKKK